MSCLMLNELPLSEQIAIELAMAERLEQRYRQLTRSFTGSPMRPDPLFPESQRAHGEPDHPPASDGDTTMDRQYRHDQTLMACARGHRPHMYQRQANRQTTYFVECSPCKVRTELHPNPEAAATAWHDGEYNAIPHVAITAA